MGKQAVMLPYTDIVGGVVRLRETLSPGVPGWRASRTGSLTA